MAAPWKVARARSRMNSYIRFIELLYWIGLDR